MGEDKHHALRIFLEEALVKPAEGDGVVMVELETCTPAGTRLSSLTFLAPDETLVLVLLSLNSANNAFIYALLMGMFPN